MAPIRALRRKTLPQTYTYRNGQKMVLQKENNQFVVRALDESIEPLAPRSAQQVSSNSTRIKVSAAELEKKMALSRKIAPTHHAYRVADTGSEFLITDRLMVRFKPDTPQSEIDALAAKYALVVRNRFSATEYLFQLTDHTGINPIKLVVALTEKEPIVALAENDLNQRMTRRDITTPTDTHYLRAWHLHERFQHADVDPRSSSRCEQAWRLLDGFGNPDVVIAITDDGCRLDHGDFDGAQKFVNWGYFRGTRLVTRGEPDADAAQMYKSGANHGTSCAGVAASEADGALTVGAAPGCRLLPIQWESDQQSLFISDSKLRQALDWIADQADVMSNSWGIVPDNLFASMVTQRIAQLASTGGRRGKGIVFLWAAGNENCPINFNGNVDIPYTDGWGSDANGNPRWIGVSKARRFRNTLVGLPGVMHVAALASTGQRSHYSNYGEGIDITAPSSNSHAFWRMTVRGLGIVAPRGDGQQFSSSFGGTSSATPLVAGIAALVISANPQLSAAEVISILRRMAAKNLEFARYAPTPPAAFDADTSWDISPVAPFAQGEFVDRGEADGAWSPWFGFGKVDAERAVAEAIARRGGTPPVPLPEPTTGNGLAAESRAALDIPDNEPQGVTDKLHLSATGEVGSVKVTIDIKHSYVGDLSIALVAPNGSSAVIHDRNGGSQRDLKRSWTSADTATLTQLAGAPIAGDWQLQVRDLAKADAGRLNRWSLAVTPASTRAVLLAEAPGVPIPDNNSVGVVRTLNTDVAGRVAALSLEVDITHSYIGDLSVVLTAPSGASAVLHDRTGGSADNLIRSWSAASSAPLSRLLDTRADGNWTLAVVDHEAADAGKLNSWRLTLSVA